MPLLLLFLAAAAAAIACPHYQRSGPWVACALPACLPARPPAPQFLPLLHTRRQDAARWAPGGRRVAAMLGQGLRPLKVWGRGQSRVGCALC